MIVDTQKSIKPSASTWCYTHCVPSLFGCWYSLMFQLIFDFLPTFWLVSRNMSEGKPPSYNRNVRIKQPVLTQILLSSCVTVCLFVCLRPGSDAVTGPGVEQEERHTWRGKGENSWWCLCCVWSRRAGIHSEIIGLSLHMDSSLQDEDERENSQLTAGISLTHTPQKIKMKCKKKKEFSRFSADPASAATSLSMSRGGCLH